MLWLLADLRQFNYYIGLMAKLCLDVELGEFALFFSCFKETCRLIIVLLLVCMFCPQGGKLVGSVSAVKARAPVLGGEHV